MGLNFDTSVSGIFAAQKAIKVTQNNIANMNTEGYARQKLELSVNQGLSGGGVDAQIGNGVLATHVTRIKDEFLIEQSRDEQGQLGFYEGMRSNLSSIENAFSENSDGSISKLLSSFFNGWDELSKYPEENSYRFGLVSQAEALTSKINDVASKLDNVKSTTEHDINVQMKQINRLLTNIKDINVKISESTMEKPNSLMDERDRYIDELSKLTDVKVYPDIKNPLLTNVKVGGVTLVSGTNLRTVDSFYDKSEEKWHLASGTAMLNLTAGSLKSTLDVRNEYLPGYQAELNNFTASIINEVNSIHNVGYGLDNSTGINFFTGSNSKDININNIFKTNPERIATSSVVDSPGNADISKLIVEIKDAPLMAGGTTTLQGFYNAFSVNMATDLNVMRENEMVHEGILIRVQEEKQSVQGVSMDEELSNLLRYEQFYSANSKMLTSINKMFDTLLNMV